MSELPGPMRAEIERQADAELATLIELKPLHQPQVAALLASMGVEQLAAEALDVFRQTGGNPLLVVELAKSVVEAGDVPSGGVRALPLTGRATRVIERRLERLSLEALQILRAMAVVREDFSPELAAKLLELPLSTVLQGWVELDAAKVIHGNWFSHDLLYDQVTRSTPVEIQQLLHRQAARVLDSGKVPKTRIADHRRRGAEPRRVAAGSRARL
jgi:predicted ATPase